MAGTTGTPVIGQQAYDAEQDPILRWYGLDKLWHGGYIDLLDGVPPVDAGFDAMPIHPIFKIDNFFLGSCEVRLTLEQYQSFAPTLRLASRILSEPHLQSFFAGILATDDHKPITATTAPSYRQPLSPALKFSEAEDVDGPASWIRKNGAATWTRVSQLQHCIRFIFGTPAIANAKFTTCEDLLGPWDTPPRYGLVDRYVF